MDQKTVLIVEDSLVEQKVLSRKLKAEGYNVLLAEDGSAAVSSARRNKPDLILLDINFPPDVGHGGGVPWDGYLIMDWLRRVDEAMHTPVIFITRADAADHKDRAMAKGAAAFFHKPYNIDELLTTIQAALAEPKVTIPSGPKGKRILLVDDESDWRFVVGTYLEDVGYEVVTAKDEGEAACRMESTRLDAIMLDVNLGGHNGLLLLGLLQRHHPGVPIIIYTGMDHDAKEIQEMLKGGARQYLRKGTMGELCTTLNTILN